MTIEDCEILAIQKARNNRLRNLLNYRKLHTVMRE